MMQQAEKNRAAEHSPRAPSEQVRLLYIIDDDEADRQRSIGLLKDSRYRIHAFGSGASFIAHDARLEDACVLLDAWMPEMDGLRVLGYILDMCPGCPVVMLSGKSTLSIAVEAMKRGAADFLEKPVLKADLLGALERACSLKPMARAETLTREELLHKVTRREGQVLELLVKGHPNKVVAFQLGIAENTVEVHRQRLMRRLEVKSFADLVRLAVKAGI
jgi:two-component system, LuxR family, response regulator FixJ